jgi:hypothetical protein
MKKGSERLKRLSCYGMTLEDLLRQVMAVDPKPLWEEEKAERKKKEEIKQQRDRPTKD